MKGNKTKQRKSKSPLSEKFGLYSIDEVAKILDKHPGSVRRYIREKKLDARFVMGSWYISDANLEKFLHVPGESYSGVAVGKGKQAQLA